MVVVIAGSTTFLAFVFTRNPWFLRLTKKIILGSLVFAAFIAAIFIAERLLMV